MKHFFQYLETHISENVKPYLLFLVGGAAGAVIHRLRNKMTFWKFLSSIFISMFVAFCVGVIARDHFGLAESVVYALCGISGVFSESILDEVQEIIKDFSNFFKAKFNKNNDES